jgi:hypothetical protein
MDVIGQHPRGGVLQALAARRRHVVGPPPDMDLLLAPFRAGVVLVEARQLAVVALVQRHVAMSRQGGLAKLIEDKGAGVLRALQVGGEGDIEGDPFRLELAAGGSRLLDAERRQRRVLPAREEVLQVPLALAVAAKDEKMAHV